MNQKRMHSQYQKGFTLIELIIVIVIIAILAAVAIPKFLDLQEDAKKAAAQGVAGALGSASAANYALRSGLPSKGTAVDSCDDISALLQTGSMEGFTISTGSISNGGTAVCTVNQTGGTTTTTATFT